MEMLLLVLPVVVRMEAESESFVHVRRCYNGAHDVVLVSSSTVDVLLCSH